MILATVSSEPSFHRNVLGALGERIRFETTWALSYDDSQRLRTLGSGDKCVLIVDFANSSQAMPVARALDGYSQFATIAVGAGGNREEVLVLMQSGIRDVLPQFNCREMLQAANRAATFLGTAGELLGDLYAFVPAKPGCGATTVATYAAAAAARLADHPTLLLDFDIRLGVTTFLLKTEGAHTIIDALLQSDRLDADLWDGLVSQRENLHVLGSGPVDFSRPVPPERFSMLLDFALRRYSVVSVDLPGSMEDHECETLLRAQRIFLVCTPDIGALHVARRKSSWLQERRLTDKVSVVLNCFDRRSTLSVGEIERIIQLPVRHLLPASPNEILRAVQKGAVLDSSASLGKQVAKIAAGIAAPRPTPGDTGAVRRFVEYFSISAARKADT